jgi:hypothetical protein
MEIRCAPWPSVRGGPTNVRDVPQGNFVAAACMGQTLLQRTALDAEKRVNDAKREADPVGGPGAN